MTQSIGLMTLVITVSSVTLVPRTGIPSLPGWYRLAIVAAAAFSIATAAGSSWASMRRLRVLSGIAVANYAALLIALSPRLGAVSPSTSEVPWFLTVSAPFVLSGLIAWGVWGGGGVLVGAVIVIQFLRMLLHDDPPDAIANDVQVIVSSFVAYLIAATLIAASRDLDATDAAESVAQTRHASVRARTEARQSTEMLVHDEILATLLLASKNVPVYRDAVAVQARRGIGLIRQLASTDAQAPGVFSVDLVERLRVAISAADRHAAIRTDAADPRDAAAIIPFAAADALHKALTQALANSVAHAGPRAQRTVTIRPGAETYEVVVHDDGIGFDPSSVPGDRMGITTSIRGRLAELRGGSATIDSQRGRGATITLGWALPTEAAEAAEADEAERTASRSGRSRHETIRADRATLRWRTGLGAGVFLASQAWLAYVETPVAHTPWLPGLAFAGIVLALLPLGRTMRHRLGAAPAALALAATTATSCLVFLPLPGGVLTFGDEWYLSGCSVVLFGLALRGRPLVAVLGLGAMIAVVVAAVLGQRHGIVQVAPLLARPAIIAGGGAFFMALISRMRARADAARLRELRLVREDAFSSARSDELRQRSRALESSVGPMLRVLGEGNELSVAQARECVALEGRLRDQYRAGSLAREPLLSAAAAARRRGIDVVLIDDGVERRPADADAIARWMALQLDRVSGGQFVGRLLPVGRDARASVVVDSEESTLFRG